MVENKPCKHQGCAELLYHPFSQMCHMPPRDTYTGTYTHVHVWTQVQYTQEHVHNIHTKWKSPWLQIPCVHACWHIYGGTHTHTHMPGHTSRCTHRYARTDIQAGRWHGMQVRTRLQAQTYPFQLMEMDVDPQPFPTPTCARSLSLACSRSLSLSSPCPCQTQGGPCGKSGDHKRVKPLRKGCNQRYKWDCTHLNLTAFLD